jgi:hypothetical protein
MQHEFEDDDMPEVHAEADEAEVPQGQSFENFSERPGPGDAGKEDHGPQEPLEDDLPIVLVVPDKMAMKIFEMAGTMESSPRAAARPSISMVTRARLLAERGEFRHSWARIASRVPMRKTGR